MWYRILPFTVIATCSLATVEAQQKQSQSIAYAITSSEKGSFNWTDVKQIDFATGAVTRSVFDAKQTNFTVYSARTGKELTLPAVATGTTTSPATAPVASLAAACAYDVRHNRLYYAPMFLNQLRYIDLDAAAPKIYYFDNEQFTTAADLNNDANHITRMVIGADGDGYALSNDGNHLLRFTTGKKPVITDLGALSDDAANGTKSIHEKNIAWGGDMVADANGDLLILSAFQKMFRVNIDTKVATYIAEIKGIPATFTTNGAVVDNEGKMIVSSANVAEGFYQVDMHTWQATKITTAGANFNVSDLANGNLAFANDKSSVDLINRAVLRNQQIALYPNPITSSQLYVSFNVKETGRYTVQLVDLNGKMISQQIMQINSGTQVVPMTMYNSLAKGAYLVKVLNNGQKAVFTDKLLVD